MTPGELTDLGHEVERALALAADPDAPDRERRELLSFARIATRALVRAVAEPEPSPELRTAVALLLSPGRRRERIGLASVALNPERFQTEEVTR